MSYPLINVFSEFLSVTAIPEQVGNGFSKFPQKEQESACFRPILKRKSFVAIRLWRNMNWNTRNFVSVVYRKGRRYVFSQFTFAFPIIFSLDSHFPWLLRGVVAFFSIIDL